MVEHNLLLAQSIFPRLNCAQYQSDSAYRDAIGGMVAERHVGGFVLFDGDVETVHRTIADVQLLAGGTLLMSADCEDGVTMRFAGGTEFPSMMALGSSQDVSATYSVARSIAREMRAIGIHWNYAPVADINTEHSNPIINIRAFGDSPDLVADHVHAYIQGMQDGGVIACAKHFPGHGDTSVDSHSELPVIDRDRRRLDTVELVPFRTAISKGVRSVMVGHISVPVLDSSGLPASLSEAITRDLLRLEMGFDGVIVTDALDMHAITNTYGAGQAALMAYRAGADVLCIPADPAEAYNALVAAFNAKQFKVSRVKESSNRIAAMKKWTSGYQDDVQHAATGFRGHDVIALEAARRSVQLAGRMRSLPDPTIVIAVADDSAAEKPAQWMAQFNQWHHSDADAVVVTPSATPEEVEAILARVEAAASAVVGLFVRPRGFAGTVDVSPAQREVVAHALAGPSILVDFGNPYLLRDLDPTVRVDTFSASNASIAASFEALSRAVK